MHLCFAHKDVQDARLICEAISLASMRTGQKMS